MKITTCFDLSEVLRAMSNTQLREVIAECRGILNEAPSPTPEERKMMPINAIRSIRARLGVPLKEAHAIWTEYQKGL